MFQIQRLPGVMAATGLSRSTIYAMMSAGSFPRPIKLGERAVGWLSKDLDAWLDSRETSNGWNPE